MLFRNILARQTYFSYLIFFIFSLLIHQVLLSQPQYKMRVVDGKYISSSEFVFSIKVKSSGDDFNLTSYQCSFVFKLADNDYDGLTFSYIDGSSQLDNFPAHMLVNSGNNNSNYIAFASNAGSDIISSDEVFIGKFRIVRNNPFPKELPYINWNFLGNINTIVTGDLFADITVPDFYSSSLTNDNWDNGKDNNSKIGKLNVLSATPSSTSDTYTSAMKTIDGKGYNDGDAYSRWATSPMPAFIIFDLGEVKKIAETRFAFAEFNSGRIYQYSVKISKDKEEWVNVITNVSSEAKEWSEKSFAAIEARYVKLVFLSSTNNKGKWANLWEAEIWGTNLDGTLADAKDNNVLNNFELYQNYPNPFNPTTTVRFFMKEEGNVKLEVYNMLGEKLLDLLDEKMSEGNHEVLVDAGNLASGVYIYRLNVNNTFAKAKRMTLLK